MGLAVTFSLFFPSQPEQWEVEDKDPDSIIQVFKVFQGLLKVLPNLPKYVILLSKKFYLLGSNTSWKVINMFSSHGKYMEIRRIGKMA